MSPGGGCDFPRKSRPGCWGKGSPTGGSASPSWGSRSPNREEDVQPVVAGDELVPVLGAASDRRLVGVETAAAEVAGLEPPQDVAAHAVRQAPKSDARARAPISSIGVPVLPHLGGSRSGHAAA